MSEKLNSEEQADDNEIEVAQKLKTWISKSDFFLYELSKEERDSVPRQNLLEPCFNLLKIGIYTATHTSGNKSEKVNMG